MENEKVKWIKLWVSKHHDAVMKLDNDSAAVIFRNIFHYVCDEDLEEMPLAAGILFPYIQYDIDQSMEQYVRSAETARENGAKGGRPRKTGTDSKTSGKKSKLDAVKDGLDLL